MVAFINNDLTVIRDEVFHPCFIVSALDDGNIDTTTALILTTAYLPN